MTVNENGPDGRVTKTVDEARQGEETGHVRWILRISFTLAVIAIVGAWGWFATTHHAPNAPQTASQSVGGGSTGG